VLAIVVAGSLAAQLIAGQLDGFAGTGNVAFLQGLVYAAVFAGGPAALGLLLAARCQLTTRLHQLTEAQRSERVDVCSSIRT